MLFTGSPQEAGQNQTPVRCLIMHFSEKWLNTAISTSHLNCVRQHASCIVSDQGMKLTISLRTLYWYINWAVASREKRRRSGRGHKVLVDTENIWTSEIRNQKRKGNLNNADFHNS
jgi:hypothetical protein